MLQTHPHYLHLFSVEMCAKLMQKLNVDYCANQFNVQDDSGYICSKELGSLLRTLGYNPTESEVFKLMAEVDVDHNGKVGYF